MKWLLPAIGLLMFVASPASASGYDACHKRCEKRQGEAYKACRSSCRTTKNNKAVNVVPASVTAGFAKALDSGKKPTKNKKAKSWRDRF